jgi:hypothetical protein
MILTLLRKEAARARLFPRHRDARWRKNVKGADEFEGADS